MNVNLSKTKFKSLSLNHQSISPHLTYEKTSVSQTDDLPMTESSLKTNYPGSLKCHIDYLEWLIGIKWGCNCQTLFLLIKCMLNHARSTYRCESFLLQQKTR